MSQEEYVLVFPKTDALFDKTELTFSIDHIRSRETSAVYFKVDFYDMHDSLIHTYVSDRWVIDTVYSARKKTFNITEGIASKTAKYQIELHLIGITSENPLYFNNIMFTDEEYDGYHESSEELNGLLVKMNKNSFVNLYNNNGNYLQVIRPSRADLHTDKLNACQCTVLAPHLADELDIDDSTSVFLEFINQTDQRIDVLR